ncbi:hypothetical protein F2Q70_00017305 [Brassica cretica]|uniref:Uncharacterized protein n=1 Tax=Brassica cretica TaxID=69181 RepID=A0A8S9I5S3_BRACR|nr:hypothetical protein F2Q70_00017305 [Brassica cretica]
MPIRDALVRSMHQKPSFSLKTPLSKQSRLHSGSVLCRCRRTDIPSALNLSVLYRRPFGNDNRRLGGAWEAPPPWISPTYATMRLSEEWCAERWHAVVLYFPASVARNLLSRRYEPTPLEALCAEPVSLLPSKSVFLMLVRAFTLIFWQPMLWSHEVILCRFHCVWVCMSLSRTVELGGARDGLSRVVG